MTDNTQPLEQTLGEEQPNHSQFDDGTLALSAASIFKNRGYVIASGIGEADPSFTKDHTYFGLLRKIGGMEPSCMFPFVHAKRGFVGIVNIKEGSIYITVNGQKFMPEFSRLAETCYHELSLKDRIVTLGMKSPEPEYFRGDYHVG